MNPKCLNSSDPLSGVSRGHGTIEQTILAAADSGRLLPLVYIAQVTHHDPDRLPVRQSFARAARRLEDQGLIDLHYIRMPTATNSRTGNPVNERPVLCSARAGTDITDDMWVDARESAMAFYQPDLHATLQQHRRYEANRLHSADTIRTIARDSGIDPAKAEQFLHDQGLSNG